MNTTINKLNCKMNCHNGPNRFSYARNTVQFYQVVKLTFHRIVSHKGSVYSLNYFLVFPNNRKFSEIHHLTLCTFCIIFLHESFYSNDQFQ